MNDPYKRNYTSQTELVEAGQRRFVPEHGRDLVPGLVLVAHHCGSVLDEIVANTARRNKLFFMQVSPSHDHDAHIRTALRATSAPLVALVLPNLRVAWVMPANHPSRTKQLQAELERRVQLYKRLLEGCLPALSQQ